MTNREKRSSCRLPRHSTLAAYVALFAALSGGTALALEGRNTVDSGDIKNGKVRGVDVKESSLKGLVSGDGRLLTAFATQNVSTPRGVILTIPGMGAIRGECATLSEISLDYRNTSSQPQRLWIDSGASNPTVAEGIAPGSDSTDAASADDDMFTFQVATIQGAERVATIVVSTREIQGAIAGPSCQYAWQGTVSK